MKEWVREQDLFAVPVQLTYKNQKAFNTMCGGFCSLVLYLTFVTILVFIINDSMRNPLYDNYSTTTYQPYYDNMKPFMLMTNQTSVAVQVKSDKFIQKYVNRNFRVVFSAWNSQTNELMRIPAAYCSDVYA